MFNDTRHTVTSLSALWSEGQTASEHSDSPSVGNGGQQMLWILRYSLMAILWNWVLGVTVVKRQRRCQRFLICLIIQENCDKFHFKHRWAIIEECRIPIDLSPVFLLHTQLKILISFRSHRTTSTYVVSSVTFDGCHVFGGIPAAVVIALATGNTYQSKNRVLNLLLVLSLR